MNTSVTDQGIHDAGVCFNLSQPDASTLDMIEPLARRIEPTGWHNRINGPSDRIAAAAEIFHRGGEGVCSITSRWT